MNDRTLHPPESRSVTPLRPGEQRFHFHPEAGQIYVRHFFGPHPDGLPFFCNGRFYASEEVAVSGFSAAFAVDAATEPDNKRVADRIDGHDRDDLGESPDF